MGTTENPLAAIAEMIAVELGASPDEVDRWKELVRRLDVHQFEATGEIVLKGSASEAGRPRRSGPTNYDADEVRRLLDRMRTRDRVPKRKRDSSRSRRVPSVSVAEPDYDSVDNDLWLYGPFS